MKNLELFTQLELIERLEDVRTPEHHRLDLLASEAHLLVNAEQILYNQRSVFRSCDQYYPISIY